MQSESNEPSQQAWDVAKEVPIIQDEQKPRKRLSFIHFVTCTLVGILVFALAFLSKTSLLLLITISNKNARTIETKSYALLFIGCLLIAPSILTLIKSFWKMTFKDSKSPSPQTLIWVVLVDILVALGSSVLTLIAMPEFDILTNVMLLNGIATLSAALQVIANSLAHSRRRLIATSLTAFLLLISGYVFFALNYLKEGSRRQEMYLLVGLAIGGTFLVSLNWWENYAMLFRIVFLENTIRDIKRSQNLIGMLSSVMRIAVTAIVLVVYVGRSHLSEWKSEVWDSVLKVDKSTKTIVLSLFAIQVLASSLCRWLAVVACKMHAVRRSFLVPMVLTSPAVLGSFMLTIWHPYHAGKFNTTFGNYCQIFESVMPSLAFMDNVTADITLQVCAQADYLGYSVKGYALLSSSLVSWWIGLVLCTLYIWFLGIHRMERTKDLFVRNLYEAAFIDQSMLLNTRFEVLHKLRHNSKEKEMMTIYLCATMWHETYDEMMKMIISMFRLDKYRPKRNSFNDVSFESHIYFDDAFLKKEGKWLVNEYAETLVAVIREVYIIFSVEGGNSFTERSFSDQKIFPTPYGCRLHYTLPRGNALIIHFKNKHKIRHKKRWSQIMYLYYLLGWKLSSRYFRMRQNNEMELKDVEKLLKKDKENTYILALDGDTDFQPSAVMLLVDRLRMYPEVGAACGRIHPTGTGPMVWYQKFEYAVGHWLQKTAEHVFGSVLCSPGCFSLFRAAALMDDNVMKRYTTKPTEASHYVQYDQGEDRWLCTLLLQQGWRVEYNAASDSYTNAPQEFKEFYNQRRRWGPSTMANTLDLLSSGSLTSEKNKSISKPYILYQIISMGASILGPATVCLMIAGCFKNILHVDANLALVLAILPPAVYLAICFYLGHTKSEIQITLAAIMSIFYAFLMTATLLSIIGDLVIQGTFMTPSGLFFIGIASMYFLTALLHPNESHLIIFGLLYVICIPSGYLLLAIYSMVNMNNVSWGTRETAGATSAPKITSQKDIKCQKLLQICGYSLEVQLSQEVKVMTMAPEPTNLPQVSNLPQTALTDVNSQVEQRNILEDDENRFVNQLIKTSGNLPLVTDTLPAEEEHFWKDLIKVYLKPLESDKAKEEKIKADLKDLRNKASFVFFICNALWLVATFFLQAIGSSVTINVPKLFINGTVDPEGRLFIDPIGLMFVLSFAGLLIIQFFAMLWHRIQTLIHFIAYNGTEAAVNRRTIRKSMEMVIEDNNFL